MNVINTIAQFDQTKIEHVTCAILILAIGYWISKTLSARAAKIIKKHASKHNAVICQRFLLYAGMLLFIFAALQQLGFNLSVLLGAAGVFTVGLGFAAQTSLANLISGLFLLLERPFKIGDSITAKGFSGVVESIDLLSTRLCTSDNTLIRIPNENIMQSEIINLNYFPRRRVSITLNVAYNTDIEKARKILILIAKKNPLTLESPEPTIKLLSFGDSSIGLLFRVWGLTANHDTLLYALQETIKTTFEQENIEMPFPQMTIHSNQN